MSQQAFIVQACPRILVLPRPGPYLAQLAVGGVDQQVLGLYVPLQPARRVQPRQSAQQLSWFTTDRVPQGQPTGKPIPTLGSRFQS